MVEYIKHGDTEYPYIFGWSAFKELQAEITKDKASEAEAIEIGCFLGFKHGARKEKVELKITRAQMVEMFDDDLDFQEKVSEVWGRMFGRQKKIAETMLQGGL